MKYAFSLVELSIVLVILGLLTGGILAGQSLIAAAEVRSVIVDQQRYQAAVMTFRDKYFAMPGDMRNAHDFWNIHANCDADQAVTAGDDTGCNGDGDGQWEHGLGEHFKVWTHLSMSGLIEGNYTGSFSFISDYQAGTNLAPTVRNGFWIPYYTSLASQGYTAGSDVNNKYNLYHLSGNVLVMDEAYSVDKKVDDGLPGKGNVWTNMTCTLGNNVNTDTAVYDLQNSDDACNVRFVQK